MFVKLGNMVHRIATSSYPAKPIGLVRIGLGLAAIIRGIYALELLEPLTNADLLRFPWFDWFPAPTAGLVNAIVGVWILSALTFTIGLWSRLSGVVLTVAMAASIAIDQQAYANHLLLLTILTGLFILTEPGAGLSIDSKRRGFARDTVAGWPLFLMQVQISIVYIFAGLTKINPLFLSGSVLNVDLGNGLVVLPEAFLVPRILSSVALFAVLTELLIGVLLWRRRLRLAAVVLGIGLHTSIALLMEPTAQLTVFAIVMLSSYIIFFAADSKSAEELSPANLREAAGDQDRVRSLNEDQLAA